MNELEQWLSNVKELNEHFHALSNSFMATYEKLARERADLEAQGKEFGLRAKKIRAMLARIRLTVTMPEEGAK